jgi:hypothetical protein
MAEEKEIYYDNEIDHAVVVSGKYIDKIKIDTEPKRSNYTELEKELTQKVSALYGSCVAPTKGGANHIEFKAENGDNLYVLEWHYEKQNIVKRVCKELNITQRELAERMDIPESTVARWKGGDLPRLAELYLNALLENIELKSKLEAIKKAHEIVSNL